MYVVRWESYDGQLHERTFDDWEDAIVEAMDLDELDSIMRVYPVERRYT